jgi:glucokinase
MVSRILHLLAVDMLSVGLAMRRPPAADVQPADGATPPGAGMLISHIG